MYSLHSLFLHLAYDQGGIFKLEVGGLLFCALPSMLSAKLTSLKLKTWP
jgi:hypothetical protein